MRATAATILVLASMTLIGCQTESSDKYFVQLEAFKEVVNRLYLNGESTHESNTVKLLYQAGNADLNDDPFVLPLTEQVIVPADKNGIGYVCCIAAGRSDIATIYETRLKKDGTVDYSVYVAEWSRKSQRWIIKRSGTPISPPNGMQSGAKMAQLLTVDIVQDKSNLNELHITGYVNGTVKLMGQARDGVLLKQWSVSRNSRITCDGNEQYQVELHFIETGEHNAGPVAATNLNDAKEWAKFLFLSQVQASIRAMTGRDIDKESWSCLEKTSQ